MSSLLVSMRRWSILLVIIVLFVWSTIKKWNTNTYYIIFFHAGADRHNGILMSLLLLVAETNSSTNSNIKNLEVFIPWKGFSIASMIFPFFNPAVTIFVVILSRLVFCLTGGKKIFKKLVRTHYRPSPTTVEGFQIPLLLKFIVTAFENEKTHDWTL